MDDYLETVRLGEVRAAAEHRSNTEPAKDALCRQHGSSTEDAFRSAIRGLRLETVLSEAGLADSDRSALYTWRGALEPMQIR